MGRVPFGSAAYDWWRRVMTHEQDVQVREAAKMAQALVWFLDAAGAYLASLGRSLRTALALITSRRS